MKPLDTHGAVVFVTVTLLVSLAIVLVAQRTPAPTRPLPTTVEISRIIAADGVTWPSQRPVVCVNGAGDVVMIIDSTSGQFRFDFSAGLVQTGKCRN